jgi:hypothetical protein
MPDGPQEEAGGWNPVVLEADDLPARIATLKKAECISGTTWKSVLPANKSN